MMKPENSAEVREARRILESIDWTSRENMGEYLRSKMRSVLDAAHVDLTRMENIEELMELNRPEFERLHAEEHELCEALRNEYRKAGATEVQLTWGIVNNIQLPLASRIRARRIAKRIDKNHHAMLPVMALAAALNEAKAELLKGETNG